MVPDTCSRMLFASPGICPRADKKVIPGREARLTVLQVLGTCVGWHPDVLVFSRTLLQALQDLQHHRYTFFSCHPQHMAAPKNSTACMPYAHLPNPTLGLAALGVDPCIIAYLPYKLRQPVCRACGHCIHCNFHHSVCCQNWSSGQGFLPRTQKPAELLSGHQCEHLPNCPMAPSLFIRIHTEILALPGYVLSGSVRMC